jgi:hypothetical protein
MFEKKIKIKIGGNHQPDAASDFSPNQQGLKSDTVLKIHFLHSLSTEAHVRKAPG